MHGNSNVSFHTLTLAVETG